MDMTCRCHRTGCRLDTDDPRHGTPNGYRNLGCGCKACTDALRTWHHAHRDHRASTTTCPNCHGPGGVYADNVCNACRAYKQRTGVDRPAEVYDPPPRTCANCGDVVPPGKRRRWGRCGTCEKYLERNGVDRPARLYAKETADA